MINHFKNYEDLQSFVSQNIRQVSWCDGRWVIEYISVISLRSVLLIELTGIPGENHRPAASHWQTLSHNGVLSAPHLSRIQTRNPTGIEPTIYPTQSITLIITQLYNTFNTFASSIPTCVDVYSVQLRAKFVRDLL
jgi:hypothetical protein